MRQQPHVQRTQHYRLSALLNGVCRKRNLRGHLYKFIQSEAVHIRVESGIFEDAPTQLISTCAETNGVKRHVLKRFFR